jgi:hypothetical protein
MHNSRFSSQSKSPEKRRMTDDEAFTFFTNLTQKTFERRQLDQRQTTLPSLNETGPNYSYINHPDDAIRLSKFSLQNLPRKLGCGHVFSDQTISRIIYEAIGQPKCLVCSKVFDPLRKFRIDPKILAHVIVRDVRMPPDEAYRKFPQLTEEDEPTSTSVIVTTKEAAKKSNKSPLKNQRSMSSAKATKTTPTPIKKTLLSLSTPTKKNMLLTPLKSEDRMKAFSTSKKTTSHKTNEKPIKEDKFFKTLPK